MKLQKILGDWGGKPIWREETPRETLVRSIEFGAPKGLDKRHKNAAEMFANIIEQVEEPKQWKKDTHPFENDAERDLEIEAIKKANEN